MDYYAEYGMRWNGFSGISPRIGSSTGDIFSGYTASGSLIQVSGNSFKILQDCKCSYFTFDDGKTTTGECTAGQIVITTTRPVYIMAWL